MGSLSAAGAPSPIARFSADEGNGVISWGSHPLPSPFQLVFYWITRFGVLRVLTVICPFALACYCLLAHMVRVPRIS